MTNNRMLIDNFEDMELVKMEFRQQLQALIVKAFIAGDACPCIDGYELRRAATDYAGQVVKDNT